MAKRKSRITTKAATQWWSASKRTTARRKKRVKAKSAIPSAFARGSYSINNSASHWNTYRQIQSEINKAWVKLQADVRKKASPQILLKDRNRLLFLLGECNYMARECMRCAGRTQRAR